jgi:hypothetical protein
MVRKKKWDKQGAEMEITEIILTAKRSGEPSSPVLTMARKSKEQRWKSQRKFWRKS